MSLPFSDQALAELRRSHPDLDDDVATEVEVIIHTLSGAQISIVFDGDSKVSRSVRSGPSLR